MLCNEFAKACGERPGAWIGVGFDDQGRSGDSLERPGMTQLREAIRAGRVQRL